MHFSLLWHVFQVKECVGRKEGLQKNQWSSPDRRMCKQREERRDLRRDVTEHRLREDLIGDLPKLA
jgi:hypothetical protein